MENGMERMAEMHSITSNARKQKTNEVQMQAEWKCWWEQKEAEGSRSTYRWKWKWSGMKVNQNGMKWERKERKKWNGKGLQQNQQNEMEWNGIGME